MVVCSDSFVSQFWTYPALPDANVIMGFATGDQARNIGHLSAEVIVDSFLKQLDAIYASQANGVNPGASRVTPPQPLPRVATANYQDYYVFDWTKQPFIRGAYTSPSIGSSVIHRQLLGQVRSPQSVWFYFAFSLAPVGPRLSILRWRGNIGVRTEHCGGRDGVGCGGRRRTH